MISSSLLFTLSKGRISGSTIHKYINKENGLSQEDVEKIVINTRMKPRLGDKPDPFNPNLPKLSDTPAIKHGQLNEYPAFLSLKKTYEQLKRTVVTDGVPMISPDGMLVSECDAIINGVPVEIKCPYAQQKPSVWLSRNTFFFKKKKADTIGLEVDLVVGHNLKTVHTEKYYLSTTHQYYHQLQAHIICSRKKESIFVIWFPNNEFFVCFVPQDPEWVEKYNILLASYNSLVLPKLSEQVSFTVYTYKRKETEEIEL